MSEGNNGSQFECPSWSVYVIDSSRKALPHSWPLAAFQSREEARESVREFKAKYSTCVNLRFGVVSTEGEPSGVIDRFERDWGPRPRLPVLEEEPD
jgi:hypothetical protein